MKIYGKLFLFLLILLIPNIVLATNHYVRKGATGDGSGSDWNNAWSDLPKTLMRGDTYYIADGTYPLGYDFDDTESGSTYIYIKKATVNDHGTDVGWSDTYGDGSAVFTDKFNFFTGYWEIDGQVGQKRGTNKAYGFVVRDSGRAINASGNGANNIHLYHIEIDGLCSAKAGCQDAGKNYDTVYVTDTEANSWHLQYLYVHDAGRTLLRAYNQDNWIVEFCYFFTPNSINGTHSEIWSVFLNSTTNAGNWVVRYNYFADPISTGGLMHVGYKWKIYGNVFVRTYYTNKPSNNGIIGSWSGYDSHAGPYIYNNTFVDLTYGNQGSVSPINNSGSIAKNNLFVNSSVHQLNGTKSHNAYSGTFGGYGSDPTENESQTIGCLGENCQSPTNIFLSYGKEYFEDTDNFGLKQSTAAGDNSIGAEYNKDCITHFDPNKCIIRGVDGTWDRGAFEFTEGDPPFMSKPDAPKNLRVYLVESSQ